jgi:hypothetical protein
MGMQHWQASAPHRQEQQQSKMQQCPSGVAEPTQGSPTYWYRKGRRVQVFHATFLGTSHSSQCITHIHVLELRLPVCVPGLDWLSLSFAA